jgi:hypothetical protein
MKARDLAVVVAMCVCVSLAIGSGFYVLNGGAAFAIAAAGAVFALATAQVVQLSAHMLSANTTQRKIFGFERELAKHQIDTKQQSAIILHQLGELRSEATRSSQFVSQSFSDLKNSYSALAEDLSLKVANHIAPTEPPQPILASFSPQVAPPATAFENQLLVSLEPIVDINSGSTAHYRIHLGMRSESGVELTHDALLAHADRMELRKQLDIFVAREATVLLARLR